MGTALFVIGLLIFSIFCFVMAIRSYRRKHASKVINNMTETSQKKTITETKNTCNACGNVWFYGKQEATESTSAALGNLGKSMMCCSGCLPAIFIPDKKVIDLNKCPKCGSRAVTKETISHEV